MKFKIAPQALTFLLLAQVMVAINIVGSKYLIQHFTPIFIITVRFLIGTIVLALVTLTPKRSTDTVAYLKLKNLSTKDWGFIFVQGLCAGTLFNFLIYWGLTYTSASMAGIVASVLPAMIIFLSYLVLREPLSRKNIICISFSVLGVMVVNAKHIDSGIANLLGSIIILLALLPEATYYLLIKMHPVHLPTRLYASLLCGINLPFLLLWLILHGGISYNIANLTVLSSIVLFIVGLSSGLFYMFWILGSRNVSNNISGVMSAFMPIAALILSRIFLHELISWLQIIGMICVIAAIVISTQE